ncbi:MAG: DUF3575 domain-containing protein [Muribaculaceae bacterium]|nr:DUF3575 domain-containing protein [Muribaculaceae bacterium]
MRLYTVFKGLMISAFLAISANASAQKVAVKTNLLYDAFASPNIGAELGVAPKWTVELSGNFNNWSINNHLWKHWFVQPEVRYWLCERFGGHFFAAHAIAGEFNFGNISNSFSMLGSDFSGITDKRYQGWGAGLGVGYGYSWILAKHWNVEAEIALGWIYTKYDVYPCRNCGRKIATDRSHNYFGPTKAAINLIYTF